MVSPELLRRYAFFAGLSPDQLKVVALASEERSVEQGHVFFGEGEELSTLYLVLEGRVSLAVNLPEKGSRAIAPATLPRTRQIVVSVAGPSEIFAWSALVPPYQATSHALAGTRCAVVAINCGALRQSFQNDPQFGYLMVLKVAQIARDRIVDLHYETLAGTAES